MICLRCGVAMAAMVGLGSGRAQAQELPGADPDGSTVPAFLVAAPAEDRPREVDLFGEELRLRAWLDLGDNRTRIEADPRAIHGFNALGLGRGGPVAAGLRWYPRVFTGGSPGELSRANYSWGATPAEVFVVRLWGTAGPQVTRFSGGRSVEFVAVDLGAEHFTARDLAADSARAAMGDAGGPGLIYSIADGRRAAFTEFTKRRLRRRIVQCVDGYAVSAPQIVSPIEGRAMVTGAFEKEALEALVGRIAAGATAIPTRAHVASAEVVREVIDATRLARIRTAAARESGGGALTFEELAAWAAANEDAAPRDDVTLIGVPFPLCEDYDSIDFLLIPSLWDCAFGAPPSPDQVVHVTLTSDPPRRAIELRGRVVRIAGRLTLRSEPAPAASSSQAATRARLRMEATSLEILD